MRLLRSTFLILLLLSLFIGGCSDDKSVTPTADQGFASKIASVTPADGSSQVELTTPIVIRFSSPQDTSSYSRIDFAISTEREYTLSKFSDSAVFSPVSQWEENSRIILLLFSDRVDHGTHYSGYTPFSAFITKITHPLIASISPVNNQTNVEPQFQFTVRFTEAMNPATITASTFYIEGVTGTIEKDSISATFTPEYYYVDEYSFRGIIKGEIETANGTQLGQDIETGFSIYGVAQSLACYYVVPSSNATDFPINGNIFMHFIGSSTIGLDVSGLQAYLSGDEIEIPCSISSWESTVNINPVSDLDTNTTYTVSVTGHVIDPEFNWPISVDISWSFTTESLPSFTSGYPGNGSTNISTRTDIYSTYSTSMNLYTMTPETFYLLDEHGQKVPATYSYSSSKYYLNPDQDLEYGQTYTVVVTEGIHSGSGLPIVQPATWTFSTIADGPIQISDFYPEDGDRNVPLDASFGFTSSTNIDIESLNSKTAYLTEINTGKNIPLQYRVGGFKRVTLTPADSLVSGYFYRLTLTEDIYDTEGRYTDTTIIHTFLADPDYLMPLAIGNNWLFTNFDITIVADTLVDGETWYKDSNGYMYINRPNEFETTFNAGYEDSKGFTYAYPDSSYVYEQIWSPIGHFDVIKFYERAMSRGVIQYYISPGTGIVKIDTCATSSGCGLYGQLTRKPFLR